MMRGVTLLLLCLVCGSLPLAQCQQDKSGATDVGVGESSPSERDETIENEIEIELSNNNGGTLAILMKLASLDRRLRASERRLEELLRQNGAQASALTEMEKLLTNRLTNTETTVMEMSRTILKAPKVAFSASVGEVGNRGPYNIDTTLIFRDVITNVGNAFNPATGIFTAPVNGVYLFFLHECSLSPQPASLSMNKNGQLIVSVAKRRLQHEGAANGSNGATLQLAKGDQVYVRLWKDSWVYDSAARFTTFSGTLLFSL